MKTRDSSYGLPLPVLAACAALVLPGAVRAAALDGDPFAALEQIDRAELGELRGGMTVGGMEVNFAVVVRTTVEGAMGPLGLQTMFTVNDAGELANAVTSAIGVNGNAGGNGANGNGGSNGFSMELSGDGTRILHQVIDGQMQALVANTADDRTINHSTDVNVTVPGFQQTSQTYFAHSHVSRMGLDSSVIGLGRF